MSGVMIVTGGGRGIGAAIARGAGQRGYRVCVNYTRSRDTAEAVVNEILGGGGEAISVPADVSVEEQVVHLFESAISELGGVTALVNNAGI
ncbi:MAG: SDR family NAD(P)-dependent oxidoreductase, partial [Gammaproteobacteria bacterium]|nr:SDR family NAD(P)-dependent oxidoreductase [Gammaproteobacteria bacterium]